MNTVETVLLGGATAFAVGEVYDVIHDVRLLRVRQLVLNVAVGAAVGAVWALVSWLLNA